MEAIEIIKKNIVVNAFPFKGIDAAQFIVLIEDPEYSNDMIEYCKQAYYYEASVIIENFIKKITPDIKRILEDKIKILEKEKKQSIIDYERAKKRNSKNQEKLKEKKEEIEEKWNELNDRYQKLSGTHFYKSVNDEGKCNIDIYYLLASFFASVSDTENIKTDKSKIPLITSIRRIKKIKQYKDINKKENEIINKYLKNSKDRLSIKLTNGWSAVKEYIASGEYKRSLIHEKDINQLFSSYVLYAGQLKSILNDFKKDYEELKNLKGGRKVE